MKVGKGEIAEDPEGHQRDLGQGRISLGLLLRQRSY